MLPWLQSNFNFPFSGDVNQKIEPDWFFGSIDAAVGDGEIEKEVFLKVASYGKQIGMLTDLLLILAEELKLDHQRIKPLSELRALQIKVEAVKASKQNRAKENAKSILDKLKKCDPEGFQDLLKEYGNGC